MHSKLLGITVIALWLSLPLQAQDAIKLGMSAPFSGPSAQLGQQFSQGANLAFEAQNADGGIGGKPIQLLTADDGYEPLRTVENTRRFILEHQVFALFGYVGTPTTNAVLPLLRKHQLPFLAPFTGADILRQPEDAFIFNFRASYREEAARQAQYFLDELQLKRVALLIQADEFGASVEKWFKAELLKRKLKPVTTIRFQRNSTEMHSAIAQLKQAKPEVVLTVGPYLPIAHAIMAGQKQNFNPVYSILSFSGASQLQQLIKPPYSVFASMVIPDPNDMDSKLAAAYRQAALSKKVTATDIGLEGFAAATVIVAALKNCSQTLDQKCLMQQLPQLKIYDFELDYAASSHQASQQIFLYQLTPYGLQKI